MIKKKKLKIKLSNFNYLFIFNLMKNIYSHESKLFYKIIIYLFKTKYYKLDIKIKKN